MPLWCIQRKNELYIKKYVLLICKLGERKAVYLLITYISGALYLTLLVRRTFVVIAVYAKFAEGVSAFVLNS